MSTERVDYDVIVIGGGPSGMMAALRASERGKHVLLLEKNAQLGKKLSITGGGRCNITNAEFDLRRFLAHYGDASHFLFSPFSTFSAKDTFTFFEEHGLPLVVEERKRAFPQTKRATDVTQLLTRCLAKAKVTVRCGVIVRGLYTVNSEIRGVETDEMVYTAHSFVLATGGRSHASTGSTGEGINWTKKLGHTTHESSPDIVPLVVREEWVKKLSGKSLDDMKITFGTLKERFSKRGKLLFTHFGLSGPLILNSARDVRKMLVKGPVSASIDLFPDLDVGGVREYVLQYFNTHKNQAFKNAVKALVPPGMSEPILSSFDPKLYEIKVNSISKDVRQTCADMCKALPLTVISTMGYDWAVVSDGGVDLHEIDTRTMASKLYPNLFLTGDILHISRPSGGYSLQLCWTTGWVAGSHV